MTVWFCLWTHLNFRAFVFCLSSCIACSGGWSRAVWSEIWKLLKYAGISSWHITLQSLHTLDWISFFYWIYLYIIYVCVCVYLCVFKLYRCSHTWLVVYIKAKKLKLVLLILLYLNLHKHVQRTQKASISTYIKRSKLYKWKYRRVSWGTWGGKSSLWCQCPAQTLV